ncbi:MAG: hypothetical protein HZB61_09250 [Nitrospirae bacterium]|nr:hypothetical protein [Nitrospirota bacterium]
MKNIFPSLLAKRNNLFWGPLIIFSIILFCNVANAGTGIGTHAGYGAIKYEEETSSPGADHESTSTLSTILFGVSGEYSFSKQANFFTGLTTDWAIGLTDDETHKENGAKFQTNDLNIFGQFYDIRFGYKNGVGNLYYRMYVSGGWDGMRLKRSSVVEQDIEKPGTTSQDISLWRTGGGFGMGYKFGDWALDGRAAYAYYPKGTVKKKNSSEIKFDTNGTCLDLGAGLANEITRNVNFYFGGSYTLIKLDGVVKHGEVLPDSKTQIIVGVANLTYAF